VDLWAAPWEAVQEIEEEMILGEHEHSSLVGKEGMDTSQVHIDLAL
jgi:hypothetical protein